MLHRLGWHSASTTLLLRPQRLLLTIEIYVEKSDKWITIFFLYLFFSIHNFFVFLFASKRCPRWMWKSEVLVVYNSTCKEWNSGRLLRDWWQEGFWSQIDLQSKAQIRWYTILVQGKTSGNDIHLDLWHWSCGDDVCSHRKYDIFSMILSGSMRKPNIVRAS